MTDTDCSDLFPALSIDEDAIVPPSGWREFQNQVIGCQSKYVILKAPCGRGKTRPALLWASNTANRCNKDKIIFAMPTQVTGNAMWKTIKSFCEPPETVGLFHGRSFVSLRAESKRREAETFAEENIDEIKTLTYQSSIFHKPIVITTLDHVLYSTIHGFRQSDYALGNLLRSVVVFDEAHYYDFTAMESLLSLMRLFRRSGIPHIVMSGTLPAFFLDRLNEEGEYQLIEDTEGFGFTPFELIRRNNCLVEDNSANEEVVDEIIRNYLGNTNGLRLRQTVILNTVARAQTFYKALCRKLVSLQKEPKTENILLYHSQFTFLDRANIEGTILQRREERPFILVGTQVIEVSLDISSDIMYTELAPVDALGQRAGRLNRGGKLPHANNIKFRLNLFRPCTYAPYMSEGMSDIMDKSDKLLKEGAYSYSKISQLCDALYEDRDLIYSPVFDLVFSEGVLFGRPYWGIADDDEKGRPGFSFRTEEISTVFVVPETVYNNDERNLVPENEVRVPVYKVKSEDSVREIMCGRRSFWICSRPGYDSELGFTDLEIPYSARMGSNII